MEQIIVKEEPKEVDSFDQLNLKETLLRGIYGYGFEKPSLIQARAIPLIMQGTDVIAQSQSGTGKTGAFTIGTIQMTNEQINGVHSIIVAHTKELAQQISDVARSLCVHTKIKVVLCMGGQDIRNTRTELSSGPIIVVCTPGRLIDLVKRRFINTRLVKLLVIDEADEMLSDSFQDQIKVVINLVPQNAQVCLFSATITPTVLDLTKRFMTNPKTILVEKEHVTLDGIQQFYVDVDNDQLKFETLCDLYKVMDVSQTIIYVNSRESGKDLQYRLEQHKFTASLIHSGMTPLERATVMKSFKNGESRILISTDLLSRGIDIQQISIVVNYDIPRNKECYIHRIGRSGRFGRKGVAINLVTRRDFRNLDDLKEYYKVTIDPLPVDFQNYLV